MFEDWAGAVLRKLVAGVTHNDPVGIALGILFCFAGSLLTTVGSLLTIKGAKLGGRAAFGFLKLGWRGVRYSFKGRPLSPLAKAIWDAFDRFDPLPGPDWEELTFGERVKVEFNNATGPVIKVWGRDVRDHLTEKEHGKLVARARAVCAGLIAQERAAVVKDLEAIVLYGPDDTKYGLTRDLVKDCMERMASYPNCTDGADASFEIDENGNTKRVESCPNRRSSHPNCVDDPCDTCQAEGFEAKDKPSPPQCDRNKCKDDRKDGCSM